MNYGQILASSPYLLYFCAQKVYNNEMQTLNLPPFAIRTIQKDGRTHIFDVIRRQYITLTPEEWVRQHFVHFLIEHKGYPLSLMANEVQLRLNGMSRRCDTVVYDHVLKPRIIIEYKAPTVNITQKVFDQICRYNMVLQVDYLIVSNGMEHYCCKIDYLNRTYQFLNEIPEYAALKEK